MEEQTVQLRDVVLEIYGLKKREESLKKELESLHLDIDRKESFLYNSLQEEAIQTAREARLKEGSTSKK